MYFKSLPAIRIATRTDAQRLLDPGPNTDAVEPPMSAHYVGIIAAATLIGGGILPRAKAHDISEIGAVRRLQRPGDRTG
jgi:hypothetical protein